MCTHADAVFLLMLFVRTRAASCWQFLAKLMIVTVLLQNIPADDFALFLFLDNMKSIDGIFLLCDLFFFCIFLCGRKKIF